MSAVGCKSQVASSIGYIIPRCRSSSVQRKGRKKVYLHQAPTKKWKHKAQCWKPMAPVPECFAVVPGAEPQLCRNNTSAQWQAPALRALSFANKICDGAEWLQWDSHLLEDIGPHLVMTFIFLFILFIYIFLIGWQNPEGWMTTIFHSTVKHVEPVCPSALRDYGLRCQGPRPQQVTVHSNNSGALGT